MVSIWEYPSSILVLKANEIGLVVATGHFSMVNMFRLTEFYLKSYNIITSEIPMQANMQNVVQSQ